MTHRAVLQVNPLAETRDGKLIAADAKLGFDDNAAFRQKELFAKRDTSQEDPRCCSVCSLLEQSAATAHCAAVLCWLRKSTARLAAEHAP